MNRDTLKEEKIGDELIRVIAKYGGHPDCKTLICFIFDPGRKIANRKRLESDLGGMKDGLNVVVLIAPN